MLHTISTTNLTKIMLDLISPLDAVLLWQDGVIFALKENEICSILLQKTASCYVLDNDILARGLSDYIDSRFHVITMLDAICLTEKHYPQIKW